LADVRTALNAVGLTGFHAIPHNKLVSDEGKDGVDARQILGGFYRVNLGVDGSPVSITVTVASDPSAFNPMESAIAAESKGGPYAVRFLRSGNVLIASASDHATVADPALADIPKLALYLSRHPARP
jgi:hypothetical protein